MLRTSAGISGGWDSVQSYCLHQRTVRVKRVPFSTISLYRRAYYSGRKDTSLSLLGLGALVLMRRRRIG